MNLDTELDDLEYASLRDLQNATKQDDYIIDQRGAWWHKNEYNWWNSDSGEEVLGSHFFDYGIKVYQFEAQKFLTKPAKD